MPYPEEPATNGQTTDLFSAVLHEDMQEIISRPPSWLVRWGTAVLLLVVVGVLILGYLIRLPVRLTVPVRLTLSAAPMTVKAGAPGTIYRLSVQDGQQVPQGYVLGYMRTIADPDQVRQLDRQLTSLRRRAASHALPDVEDIPATVDYDQLGELQNGFITFKKAQAAYLLVNQMPNNSLHGRGLVEAAYSESYLQAIDVLRNEVSAWTRDNSLSAPVAGKVGFASPLYVGQTVKADEPVFYVIPKIESSDMYGEAKLTQDQANKLRVGQSVTVRLPGHFMGEKGLMAGKIIFISEIPTADGTFPARIALPKLPHSARESDAAYRPSMQATAEVTVGNPRALERLFVAVSE